MTKTKCFFRHVDHKKKSKFGQSRCLLTISVGQQTHEDEHFDATVELINKYFGSCIMLVDDSLQRHTMALSSAEPPNYFYDMSIKEGDLWLDRNERYYGKLKNLERIIRWDAWLKHPKFNKQKKSIENLISRDKEYACSFEQAVNEFIRKYYSRIEDKRNFDLNRAKKLSFDFIIEECTALCLWAELNCHYEVYPSLHNAAINQTRERFVLSENSHLLNVVTLGFRHAKQLEPQRFICPEQAGEVLL